jgi:hypothetical protein
MKTIYRIRKIDHILKLRIFLNKLLNKFNEKPMNLKRISQSIS